MGTLVLDCSVTLAWCFEDETSDYTDHVLDQIRKSGAQVPPLWLSEVTNGLISAMRQKRLDWDRSLKFLEKLGRLPIRIAPLSSREYFTGVFQLANQEKLSSYDATYLYLAIREKSPLATLDGALRKSSRIYKLPRLLSGSK